MKFKLVVVVFCLSLFSLGYAENRHVHPQESNKTVSSSTKNAFSPGFCEIEIINDSNRYVTVSGQFDDSSWLSPFNIYPYEIPHYISLYYYNYCHASMFISITSNGYVIYSGYTPVNNTIRVVPYLNNQLKAEVRAK